MNNKKALLYFLAVISIGFLIYNYYFTGSAYGMMNHHRSYYNDYFRDIDLLNTAFVFFAYFVLIISSVLILKEKATASSTALNILNERLSKGEISIEEYQTLIRVLKESR
jgi:uncharacterized membrane protein